MIENDKEYFKSELVKEINKEHILYGIEVKEIACIEDCDDVLFLLLDGSNRYAVVHLTWSGKSENRKDKFIKYSLEFTGIYIFNMVELDLSYKLVGMDFSVSSFVEIESSEKLNHAKKIRNKKLKSFLLQTYDEVFEIICESYTLKIID